MHFHIQWMIYVHTYLFIHVIYTRLKKFAFRDQATAQQGMQWPMQEMLTLSGSSNLTAATGADLGFAEGRG